MATAWQALGSQVTLLVRGDRLLPPLEPFAGELVADALREAGVDVRLGAGVTRPAGRAREVVADAPATGSVRPTRCWSPPAARRAPTTSAWRPSA